MKSHVLALLVLVTSITLTGCSAAVVTPSPPYPPPPSVPSPTPTLETVPGRVTGKVTLQGRMSHEGVRITIGGLSPATTNSDGTYVIDGVPEGEHVTRVQKPGYLSAEGKLTVSVSGETRTLPAITLPAGDLTANSAVDHLDLALMGSLFTATDPAISVADLNGDAELNLFDLVLVSLSYDQCGPIVLKTE